MINHGLRNWEAVFGVALQPRMAASIQRLLALKRYLWGAGDLGNVLPCRQRFSSPALPRFGLCYWLRHAMSPFAAASYTMIVPANGCRTGMTAVMFTL
ncbi:hypothetical protein AU490_00340 [Lonsdalea populi]|uniref:Uncharacterized protein n=2 Tax=Lonsdalea TaxID=1082702 RepID=A0ACD1JFY7_9GAMM|nr:hypothetical protein AU499_01085 [Lonsdalea populi]RAT15611.1 hypothetical protein AU485_03250 [Lonsdalea quercina]RAT18249.1 hypothetical protein AU486_01735 [Lonsdalea quercina]RAT23836.1 hypothetical protein AU487_00325 [Lonsdalea populi]RAT26106.1 hypothetical protein AU489_05665 [Lonsdalea populi]